MKRATPLDLQVPDEMPPQPVARLRAGVKRSLTTPRRCRISLTIYPAGGPQGREGATVSQV